MYVVETNGSNAFTSLWSCSCREAFENSFRKMYGLPKEMVALPPMPDDGDHWSIQHCWAMPTPSFLEFIMFSRYNAVCLQQFNPMYHDRVHSTDSLLTCFVGCLLTLLTASITIQKFPEHACLHPQPQRFAILT